MSGKGLSNIWKARLDAIGVKLTSIVGQCYDGASNMSGEYRGVQAVIKREAGDRAVYTHCYNHVLALVLERSASDIPLVVQVFTWLNTAYKFLKHYKVIVIYDEMLKQNNLTGQYKMQSLSETRWFARSRNLDIAVNAHGLLVDLCDKVMNKTKVTEGTKRSEEKAFDADLRLMAEGLRRQLLDHNFCIALLVMKDVFSSCNAASEYLQRSAIDLLAAIEAVSNLRVTLLSSRTDES